MYFQLGISSELQVIAGELKSVANCCKFAKLASVAVFAVVVYIFWSVFVHIF